MIREDKELLLKDLSARLPYGVKFHYTKHPQSYTDQKMSVVEILEDIDKDGYINPTIVYRVKGIKPYLRPMSSMTEEEKETYHNLCYEEEREEYEFGEWVTRVYYHDTIDSIDYLNSIHIDYRGLIPKGLAIEVTEDNNPYK